MTNANPSIDPANYDSLTGTFSHVFKKLLQRIDGMLPARVVSFNRGAPARVQVQPLVTIATTANQQITRAQIASLPVMQIGGGGYILSFNLQPGDLGWIIANDRDISQFLQTFGVSNPNTFRIKNFADSVFMPDVMRGYTINAEDAEHAVLQNLAGTVRIALWPNQVKITAPDGVLIDGDLTVTGTITGQGSIAADGGLSASGGAGPNSVVITGNLRTVGNIEATGDITPHVP